MRYLCLLMLALVPAGCCHRHLVPPPPPIHDGQISAQLWVGTTFLEPHVFDELDRRGRSEVAELSQGILHDVNLGCGDPWQIRLNAVGVDVGEDGAPDEEALTRAVNGVLETLETDLRVFQSKFRKHECINGNMWCKLEFDLYRFRDGGGWTLLTSDYQTPIGPLHAVYDVTVAFEM